MDSTLNRSDLAARARAIAPLIAAAAARMEAARQLAPDVLDALHEAQLFRLALPRVFGGLEADLVTILEVCEAIAAADASTAWCLGQSVGCAAGAAYLEPSSARTVFADTRAVLAWGPTTKETRAVAVAGGHRITGTVQFLSGLHHASWVGMRVAMGGPEGAKVSPRTFLFPRNEGTIRDVWHVSGLRATGSDSVSVEDLFVPDAFSFQFDEPADLRARGTLYRFSTNMMFATAFGAVALGIARGALDAFADLAGAKAPQYWPNTMRESQMIQNQFAINEAKLRAARAYLESAVRAAWVDAEQAGGPSAAHKIDLRLAASHAIHAAKDAVDFSYQSAGASAVFESNPFERRFRDIHAVSQQIQGSTVQFTNAGQILFGLPPDNPRTI